MLITGSRKGIGRYLAEYYLKQGYTVAGCSREASDLQDGHYKHYCVDIADEAQVKKVFIDLQKSFGTLDVLINNAGIASMNNLLLTPVKTVQQILNTNVVGTFLFCRESAKLMMKNKTGRIVNFTTVATPLQLEGEAIYAASKAAIVNLTQIMAKEFSPYGITVNAVGPCPVQTDLIKSVPKEKIDAIISKQSIHRLGEFKDVSNVIDFFISKDSNFVTGQTIYLGGIS